MDELNKKLGKWAGFLPIYDTFNEDHSLISWEWPKPNGRQHVSIPDFINSLDACCKWLTPKCGEWRLEKYGEDKFGSKFCANVYLGWDYWEHGFERAEAPAVALCKAIEKAIDSRKEE